MCIVQGAIMQNALEEIQLRTTLFAAFTLTLCSGSVSKKYAQKLNHQIGSERNLTFHEYSYQKIRVFYCFCFFVFHITLNLSATKKITIINGIRFLFRTRKIANKLKTKSKN